MIRRRREKKNLNYFQPHRWPVSRRIGTTAWWNQNPCWLCTEPVYFNSTRFIHRKLWTNQLCPQLSVAKQSPNS